MKGAGWAPTLPLTLLQKLVLHRQAFGNKKAYYLLLTFFSVSQLPAFLFKKQCLFVVFELSLTVKLLHYFKAKDNLSANDFTSIPDDPCSDMSLMKHPSLALSGLLTSPSRTLVGKHSRRTAGGKRESEGGK